MTLHRTDFAEASEAYLAETPAFLMQRFARVLGVYGHEAESHRDFAREAIAAGRPAFWSVATYHNQRALGVLNTVNLEGAPLYETLIDIYPDYVKSGRKACLDMLIPLDRKAVNALARAYWSIGCFVEDGELEQRRMRDMRRAA